MLFLEKEGNPSGNGGVPKSDLDDAANEAVERLIQSQARGDLMRAIDMIKTENSRYRADRRTMRKTIAQIEAQMPTKEDVVLKGNEAKDYVEFAALKLTPKQIAETLKAHETLVAKDRDRSFTDAGTDAAKVAGLKAGGFLCLMKMKGLMTEVREVEETVDGEKVKSKQVYVRPSADEKAEWKVLDKFVEGDAEVRDLVDALRIEDHDGDAPAQGNATRNGVNFPKQSPSSDKAPATINLADRHAAQTYVMPSQRKKTKESST